MGEMSRAAAKAHRSDALDWAARLGLVAYGLVHIVIGWLALQIAFGEAAQQASGAGAMHALADQPFGAVLVWGVAVGLFLLVAWRIIQAWQAFHVEDGVDQVRGIVGPLGKGVLYGALAVSATKVALGDSKGGSGTDSFTSQLMGATAGQFLVGAVGLGVLGYGGYYLYLGWTKKFLEKLDGNGRSGDTGNAYEWIGRTGFVAKGTAVGLIGALFVYAAVTHDPKKSAGLDQALQEIAQQPFGKFVLAVVAVGIASYGLFAFARARHLSH